MWDTWSRLYIFITVSFFFIKHCLWKSLLCWFLTRPRALPWGLKHLHLLRQYGCHMLPAHSKQWPTCCCKNNASRWYQRITADTGDQTPLNLLLWIFRISVNQNTISTTWKKKPEIQLWGGILVFSNSHFAKTSAWGRLSALYLQGSFPWCCHIIIVTSSAC